MNYGEQVPVDTDETSAEEILYILRRGEGEIEVHFRGNQSGYWFRYSDGVLEKLHEGYGARPVAAKPATEDDLRRLLITHQPYYVEVDESIFEDTVR